TQADSADSGSALEALQPAGGADRDDLRPAPPSSLQKPGHPTRTAAHSLSRRRIAMGALALATAAALAMLARNYLDSYESTDDAQIDGHIDPLSSRIEGTVIAVHAEDDDPVKKGELLVELDPRDYEVAVQQA